MINNAEFSINDTILLPLVEKPWLNDHRKTELPTQIRVLTEQSVNCTWSGGTIPVCLCLPAPVQTKDRDTPVQQ